MMSESGRRGSRLVQAGALLAAVAALVAGFTWWQDRPLAEARRKLEAGDAALALEDLNAFLQDAPGKQRALLLKARALVALNRNQEAIQIFSRTGAGTTEELHAWAKALMSQRQWAEALPFLEQLGKQDSANGEIFQELTICRFQAGQVGAAIESATRLCDLPGHQLDGLFQRGVIYRSMGNFYEAIENWEQIAELAPEGQGLPISPAEFFRVLAEDLLAEERPRQSRKWFERSLAAQRDAEVLAQLGKAHFAVDAFDDARNAWHRVLEQDFENHAARTGLAELALQEGDPQSAIEVLEPISVEGQATEFLAYLMRRAHTQLRNDEMAFVWKQKGDAIRKSKKLRAALESRSN